MKVSRNIEFKESITNSFLKTVSAFANFCTGTILFGITNDGKPTGVENPEGQRLEIENRINDCIHPKPDYRISINHKTNVVSLYIMEGRQKPYLYRGKAYRRSDTSTVEVDDIELRRLVLEGSNLYYEDLPSIKEDLSFRYLEAALIDKLGVNRLSSDMLRTLGFFTVDKKYNNAAALFADTNQFCGIDIAKFGNSINEISDRETIAGVSILKQYDSALSFFRRYYQYEQIEGFERKTVQMIPEEAFREVIANALIHRTWDINSHIRIAMFNDRIEIASPGGLPKGITEEEYLNGAISNLRNPIIGNLFFRLHLIEMFGTGIRRVKEAYANAPVKPVFVLTSNTICVTLPCVDTKIQVSSDGKNVLDALRGGMMLSSTEIAEMLGWSKDKAVRVINALLNGGYVQKIGNGRGTKYLKR